jgi:hypothetical protein
VFQRVVPRARVIIASTRHWVNRQYQLRDDLQSASKTAGACENLSLSNDTDANSTKLHQIRSVLFFSLSRKTKPVAVTSCIRSRDAQAFQQERHRSNTQRQHRGRSELETSGCCVREHAASSDDQGLYMAQCAPADAGMNIRRLYVTLGRPAHHDKYRWTRLPYSDSGPAAARDWSFERLAVVSTASTVGRPTIRHVASIKSH